MGWEGDKGPPINLAWGPRRLNPALYMINDLHWLPILARVRYKVLLLVAKFQQVLATKYLCELMYKQISAIAPLPLRSADRCDLLVPRSRRLLLYPRTGPL